MKEQDLDAILTYANYADSYTNGMVCVYSQLIRDIVEEIKKLRKESDLDYKDMRSFQAKYIESDHQNINLKDALNKIAFLKNEWDDPIDFINDLQNIAKESLIK